MTKEEVIEILENEMPCNKKTLTYSDDVLILALDMAIKALSEPIRPKGHWIMTSDYYTGAYGTIDYVKCSCCGEDSLEEGDFCPNCGADMREVEE